MGQVRLFRLAVASAVCAFAATAAYAAPLTLQEAQRRAIDRSRELDAQDAAIRSSREMAHAAGELPDPVLRAGIDNVPADGPDRFSLTRDFMTMRRIGVMQEFTRAEKREAKRERYERQADVQAALREADVAAIQRDTALAWLELYYLERSQQQVEEFVRATRLEVQAVDAGYRAGRTSQGDTFSARSAVAMALDREDDIARKLRAARIALARWIGGAPDEPLAGAPDLSTVRHADVDLEEHLKSHPEIIAAGRQAQVADAEARIALLSKKPDWTWEAAYQVRGPAFSNMFSIGVSIPLPWDAANRQDRETGAKLAAADEARAKRDEMLRAHVAEVAGMREEWRTGLKRLARFRNEIEPLARERTSAVTAAYAGSKGSLDDVLASRRAELEVALQAIQVESDVARAWARLNYLLPDDVGLQRSHANHWEHP